MISKKETKKKQSTLSFNMNEEEERNSKSECESLCMFITCDISTTCKSHDIAHYFSGKSHCCSDKVQDHMISHMMW